MDARRIRLLLISPGGLGLHYHGPAISLFRLLSELKDRLWVDVLHGLEGHGDLAPLEGRAIRTGTVRKHFRNSVSYPLSASWFILKNRKRYDVVLLATSSFLTLVPGAIAHACGMQVIVRAAAIAEISTETGGQFGKALKRGLMRCATTYLAISIGIFDELKKTLGASASIHYIPNSVDTERFLPRYKTDKVVRGSPAPQNSAACLRLVCVGAVGDRKGQHLIVEAMSHLPQNVSLTLIGPCREPEYLRRIERMARAFRLEGRIVHIPFMEDVERAYWAGDIFILPSSGEGMPNAMLEAMSSGLVPIGSRISGIEDLVQDDCGNFVQRDARSIANAVMRYVEHPQALHSEGMRAQEIIQNAYSTRSLSKRFFTLLASTSSREQGQHIKQNKVGRQN